MSLIWHPVASFLKKYPDVSIGLCFDDRQVDVVSKGYDAGIRLSDILAKDVTVFKLVGPIEFVTAASPSYLKKSGRPKHPRNLLNHRCIWAQRRVTLMR
jgi:DNA-binding transcriptional LysR family regulator